MGYQESFFKPRMKRDFDKFVEVVREKGKDYFDMAKPVAIITLKKDVVADLSYMCDPRLRIFKRGDKFVWVVGERSAQRDPYLLFFQSRSPNEDEGDVHVENIPTTMIGKLDLFFCDIFPEKVWKGLAKNESEYLDIVEFPCKASDIISNVI